MYLMALLCHLYGEKDCSRFLDAWFPLAYTLAMMGKIFNWGGIFSNQLGLMIEKVHQAKKTSGMVLLSTWHLIYLTLFVPVILS
jgi:hypothetical protein